MKDVTTLSKSIEAHVAEMRELTLAAGVPESTFNQIVEVDQNLTIEDLENRLAFLEHTRNNEYWEVLNIWRLLPPEIWNRYEQFGESQLREQKLLRDARKKLRKVWRKRYGEKEPVPEQGVDQAVSA